MSESAIPIRASEANTRVTEAAAASLSSNDTFSLRLLIAAALSAVVCLLFTRAVFNGFVSYDDSAYVVDNPVVQREMSLDSLRGIWNSAVMGNWHPVTMLSHMLDCQLYGLNPWGHHLTSVLLHAANTGLLFWVLARMTGRLWPSALVAALFGVHPLRVESVAWVAERKDVLSTFFWFLGLWAYSLWVERRAWQPYLAVVVCLTLGLLSKPMLVTFPCLLLLLDYWPLGRVSQTDWRSRAFWQSWRGLVIEKLPLFAIAGLISRVTYQGQAIVVEFSSWEPKRRAGFVLLGYGDYLRQMFWPSDLAVFYPRFSASQRMPSFIISTVVVIGVALLALLLVRKLPYLFTGWFWFLGTLVPVVGFVQAGSQARADRYSYVPLVGVFLVIAWLLADIVAERRTLRVAVSIACVGWLLALSAVTYRQIGYWEDSESLFRRAIDVTPANFLAEHGLANALFERGAMEEGLDHLDRALKASPGYAQAMSSKASVLRQMMRLEEASHAYQTALEIGLKDPAVNVEYGQVLLALEGYDGAREQFEQALGLNPKLASAYSGIGDVEARLGHAPEALGRYQDALQLQPDYLPARGGLAWLLATHPNSRFRNGQQAIQLAQSACEATAFADPRLLTVLSAALAEIGQFDTAVQIQRRAIDLALPLASRSTYDQKRVADFQTYLASYLNKQPWRESPATSPSRTTP